MTIKQIFVQRAGDSEVNMASESFGVRCSLRQHIWNEVVLVGTGKVATSKLRNAWERNRLWVLLDTGFIKVVSFEPKEGVL